MQSRHARRRIHHVCECTRGGGNGWEEDGGGRGVSRAGFVYPLARPCIIKHPPPRVDIINDGNAIFSGAMQFRVPLPRVRLSVRRSLNSPPRSRSPFPPPSPLDARPFIYLPLARAHARYFVYFPLVPLRRSIRRETSVLPPLRACGSRLMSARIALNASQRACLSSRVSSFRSPSSTEINGASRVRNEAAGRFISRSSEIHNPISAAGGNAVYTAGMRVVMD